MAQVSIQVRVDENIKKRVEELYSNLGLNISSAINIFFRQSLKERGIPFMLKEENGKEQNYSNIIQRLEKHYNKDIANISGEIENGAIQSETDWGEPVGHEIC